MTSAGDKMNIRKSIMFVSVFSITGIFASVSAFAESGNLALNKPAAASSTCEKFVAAFANDGKYETDNSVGKFWCSAEGKSANSWWSVDLGEKCKLNEVKLKFRKIGAYRFIPGSIAILVSDDNKTWTVVLPKSTTNLPAVGASYSDELSSFPVSAVGRYVKLLFEDKTADSEYDVVQLVEVEVLGDVLPK